MKIFFINAFFVIILINLYMNKENNNLMVNANKAIDIKIDYTNVINNLKEEYNNEDIVGILQIPNTDFNIPVVQGKDNDYYLNYTLNKESNYMGSIFLDYRINIDTSKKLLIYGHSYPRDNFPFNVLENYYDYEYCNNHKYIELITSNGRNIYEIFSVYVETNDFSYMNIEFIDNTDFFNHIESLKNKSIHNIDVDLKEDDNILILQTCSNHIDYSEYSKKYLLVISRRVNN